MSGATAPKKQGKELNEFSMDGKRKTDAYVAKYKKAKAENNGLASGTTARPVESTSAAKSGKKKDGKSPVRDLCPVRLSCR